MSDFESQQRKKRLEDIENKRKRLEEMRKLRKDRVDVTSSQNTPPDVKAPAAEKINVDDLVNSLLTQPDEAKINEDIDSSKSVQPSFSVQDYRKMRAAELTTISNVFRINIAPVIVEKYEHSQQTEPIDILSDEEVDMNATPHRRTRTESLARGPPAGSPLQARGSPIRQRSLSDLERSVHQITLSESSATKALSQEEIGAILKKDTFRSFVHTSSRIIDRALGLAASIDILRDYTGADKVGAGGTAQNALMSVSRTYSLNEVEDRPIMDIQVSPHHPELFLVSYGAKNAGDPKAPASISPSDTGSTSGNAGVVCLWSIILPSLPEFTFTCTSPVLTARFHPDDPHLIVGGCYSGQIVLWDTRSPSPRPSARSTLAGKGHKHPVFSLCLAKSGGGSAMLITAGTDGSLCHWDINNLTEPISSTHLFSPSPTLSPPGSSSISHPPTYSLVSPPAIALGKGRPVCVSCMTLGPDEDNRKLVVGTEAGTLCSFTLPFKPAASFEQVGAHLGLITSVTVNPSSQKVFKGLALSSSVDWSVKLWNLYRLGTAPSPLMEFNASAFDYFCAVKWSPSHPGLFSAITSGGVVLLWNICQSVVEPVAMTRMQLQEDKDSGAPTNKGALNKTTWTMDGRKLLVGDSRGHTMMVSVKASVVGLRAGDEERFEFYLDSSRSKISSSSSTGGRSGLKFRSASEDTEMGESGRIVGNDEAK